MESIRGEVTDGPRVAGIDLYYLLVRTEQGEQFITIEGKHNADKIKVGNFLKFCGKPGLVSFRASTIVNVEPDANPNDPMARLGDLFLSSRPWLKNKNF